MLKINLPLDADGNIQSLGPLWGAMAIKKKYDVDVTVELVPHGNHEAMPQPNTSEPEKLVPDQIADDYLTILEAARQGYKSRSQINNDVREQNLPHVLCNGVKHIKISDLNRLYGSPVVTLARPPMRDLLDQPGVLELKRVFSSREVANDAPEYMSTAEVARAIGVSMSCLYNNRRLRKKLGMIQHGKGCTVKYPKCKVDAYVKRFAV